MREVEEDAVDIILTDPPYGVTKNKWDRLLTQDDLNAFTRITNNIILFSGARPDQLKNILNLRPSPARIYIWHYTFSLTNSQGAFWTYQPIYDYGKKLKGLGKDILVCNCNDKCGKIHPTQKPIQLMYNLVKHSTIEGEVLLDPFMGSGTTAAACEKLGRRWIGIEINKDYCEIAKQRIEREIAQLKLAM